MESNFNRSLQDFNFLYREPDEFSDRDKSVETPMIHHQIATVFVSLLQTGTMIYVSILTHLTHGEGLFPSIFALVISHDHLEIQLAQLEEKNKWFANRLPSYAFHLVMQDEGLRCHPHTTVRIMAGIVLIKIFNLFVLPGQTCPSGGIFEKKIVGCKQVCFAHSDFADTQLMRSL